MAIGHDTLSDTFPDTLPNPFIFTKRCNILAVISTSLENATPPKFEDPVRTRKPIVRTFRCLIISDSFPPNSNTIPKVIT